MSDDDLKRKILKEYMLSASPEERKELKKLLSERKSRESIVTGMRGMNVDVSQLAKNMSAQINRQLGMADINIKRMARDLVTQMAHQHKPDITPDELAALIKQMVPDNDKEDLSRKIPAGMMRKMIVQFISYSTGVMPDAGREGLPSGWEKKYWAAFPENIRYLITAFLKQGIDSTSFWSAIDKILAKRTGGR